MSEGAAAFARTSDDGRSRAVGRDELTEGLMLVRASTIKVVRLQLAMERRDRRLALETVDDLVLLDGKIRDFLDAMPTEATRDGLQRELDEQMGALAREKLTLAAGMSGRVAGSQERAWIEQKQATMASIAEARPVPAEQPVAPEASRDWLGADWAGAAEGIQQETRANRTGLAISIAALLLFAFVLAAILLWQTTSGQALIDQFTRRA